MYICTISFDRISHNCGQNFKISQNGESIINPYLPRAGHRDHDQIMQHVFLHILAEGILKKTFWSLIWGLFSFSKIHDEISVFEISDRN